MVFLFWKSQLFSVQDTTLPNTTYRGAVIADFFNGKEKDYESGLHYYGARYYDCELLTGWLSMDPMADKYTGMSSYNYCAWNPICATDPNGMDSVKTPNGMANARTGYKVTLDGKYLYGDGLRIKKRDPYLEIGGIVGSQGGYVDCCEADISGFQVSLAAGGSVKSLDGSVGVGSDGLFTYKRTKSGKLTPGTAANKVNPLSKSFIGKSVMHGANTVSVLWAANDVRASYIENGFDSPETYSSIGGFAGTSLSILASTGAGVLAGAAFGGVGTVPGAMAGFVAGTISSILLDAGGRKSGEAIYKKTH